MKMNIALGASRRVNRGPANQRGLSALRVGLLFLLPSLYLVLLGVREVWLENTVGNRYQLTNVLEDPDCQQLNGPRSYSWRGQTVVLGDDFDRGNFQTDETRAGLVKITVNGRYYTWPYPLQIRASDCGSNRYWQQVTLAKFDDTEAHTERLVVLQSFPNYELNESYLSHVDALKCRVLYIDDRGGVTQNVFRFSDRSSPPYRTILARSVSPCDLGFYSNALTLWPTLFYPVLYPFVTGLIGLVMTIVGLRQRRRARTGTGSSP